MKKQTYCVLESDAGRMDILVARLLGFSRARVRGLMDHEGVTLNGMECSDYGTQVVAGDQIGLAYDPERKYREKPIERRTHGFRVVYRDEHLAIVDKDAGVLTVPTIGVKKTPWSIFYPISLRAEKPEAPRSAWFIVWTGIHPGSSSSGSARPWLRI
jgi:23S rRNA-/tRNA-specific pseudouridylate synthase